MKTNFSLLFYLKKSKNYQNGPVAIYMRITVDGKRSERSYSVYIGKLDDKEIDFIAEKAGNKIYIQVTYKWKAKVPLVANSNP
jgi:hypothetical protein